MVAREAAAFVVSLWLSLALFEAASPALIAAGSAFFGHKFIAGRTGSRNLVRLIPRGKPTINTGNSFYFDYTLTYDLAVGTVSLSDSNLKGN